MAQYAIVQSVSPVLFAVLGLQLEQAFVRGFNETHDKYSLFATSARPGLFLYACALLIVVILNYSHVDGYNIYIWYFYISSALTYFVTTFSLLSARMDRQLNTYYAAVVLPRASLLILILLSVFLITNRNIAEFVYMYLAASAGSALFCMYRTRKYWSALFKAKAVDTRPLLAFSLPLIPAALAFTSIPALDRAALHWLSTQEQLALFAASASIANVASLAVVIFGSIWTPWIYQRVASDNAAVAAKSVLPAITLGALFIWSGVAIFADLIVLILPSDYHVVKHYLGASISGPLLYIVSEVAGCGISITKRTALANLPPIFALICGVTAHWFLTPSFGAAGAAAASVSAFGVFFVTKVEISSRIWHALPRLRTYLTLGGAIGLSLLSALWGAQMKLAEPLLWLVLLVAAIGLFRGDARQLISLAKRHLGGGSR